MDSLSQLCLGGAVGTAVLGHKVGYRAALWGAVCGTLPDLDVFIDFGGAVENFTYHRGFSHSLFVLTLLAPLLTWLIVRIHPQTRPHWRGWLLLTWLALITHPLLDSFTVYGTQILWPLQRPPTSWSTIFIIDPLFTVPVLAGLLCALLLRRRRALGRRLNFFGLALGGFYLAWTVGAKLHVEAVAAEALADRGVRYQRLLTTPAPFNTLLWRIVAVDDDGYHVAFYSVFDDGDEGVRPQFYPSEERLLEPIAEHWPVQRLRWFTHGFYRTDVAGSSVTMTDLRMGLEDAYVFSFSVARQDAGGEVVARPAERRESPRDLSRLSAVWERIWNPLTDL